MQRRTLLGGTALVAGAALAGFGMRERYTSEIASPRAGPLRFPNVPLVTHRGERVRFYDDLIRGDRIVVFNMTYTQCRESCGGTLANLVRVQRLLGARVGNTVHLYSVSLDPKVDTPDVLARHARDIGADWTFLTGRPADIEQVRRALGFVDSDPIVDRDRNRHSGMVRVGNDALDRWISCPGIARAEQLAQEVLWVGTTRAA